MMGRARLIVIQIIMPKIRMHIVHCTKAVISLDGMLQAYCMVTNKTIIMMITDTSFFLRNRVYDGKNEKY
jgi:hypothetical protein